VQDESCSQIPFRAIIMLILWQCGYTYIKWLESDEAPDSWGKVEHPSCEQLTKYIITAKFYD